MLTSKVNGKKIRQVTKFPLEFAKVQSLLNKITNCTLHQLV